MIPVVMLVKKIYVLSLFLFACSGDDESQRPSVPPEPDEPKQYGLPYASVPEPQNTVIYEVNIRAFSKDGNLQGVIDRLDNIKSLGINTLWLMPIHPVGQVNSAGGLGSPYAVQDYKSVNPEFGDMAKLRELVQKAHEKKMAVILDWVANHTAWDNPWMKEKSWYAQDTKGNVIVPPGTNWKDVAELNYDNYDMRKAMIQAMKYWVLEANVDGFRCDAVDFVPTDFWKQALDELKAIPNRKFIFLAEGGKPENFTAGFQMNYAWDFYNAVKQVYSEGKPASLIMTTHQQEYNNIPAGAIKLRYTTNHDQSAWEATPVEALGGEQASVSAAAITILTSAAPLLYSSQEVGRTEKLAFFTRDPIDWTANAGITTQYTKLLSLYNSSHVFTKGTLTNYTTSDVVMFTRKKDKEEYLVLVNVRNASKDIAIDAALQGSWTNAVDDVSVTLSSTKTLSPYEYLVLKK